MRNLPKCGDEGVLSEIFRVLGVLQQMKTDPENLLLMRLHENPKRFALSGANLFDQSHFVVVC